MNREDWFDKKIKRTVVSGGGRSGPTLRSCDTLYDGRRKLKPKLDMHVRPAARV